MSVGLTRLIDGSSLVCKCRFGYVPMPNVGKSNGTRSTVQTVGFDWVLGVTWTCLGVAFVALDG